MPTGGWPLYVVLVLAVSLLGGYMIGQWWQSGVALGSNIVFSALYLFAYDDLFRIHQITIDSCRRDPFGPVARQRYRHCDGGLAAAGDQSGPW